MGLRQLGVAATIVGLAASLVVVAAAPAGAAPATYVVDGRSRVSTDPVDGSCTGGTEEVPWRTVAQGMRCLKGGDTLLIRGGDYYERVSLLASQGSRAHPITVRNWPGERPVLKGFLRLERPDHWRIDGLNVTSDSQAYDPGQYLVKLRGGRGWSFENAEVWNARSYAAVRVERSDSYGPPGDWRLSGNCIHDTRPTNGLREDHNVYVDTGADAGPGLIERNLIFNAPNGQNLKLGPGSDPSSATRNVVVRYNTFWNGVQNVLANGRSHDINVHRNLMGAVIRQKDWYPNVRGFELTGARNVAANNLGIGAPRIVHNHPRMRVGGWRDGGGNRPLEPRLNATNRCDGFVPTEPGARTFGRWAAEAVARPIESACPEGTPSAGFMDVPRDDPHARAIDCIVWWRLAGGTSSGQFTPGEDVTRAQMATFIANLVLRSGGTLPPVPRRPAFDDTTNSSHRESIERLAAAGIIAGTGERIFSPGRAVNRGQMATFLAEAVRYRTGSTLPLTSDFFPDDDRTSHERNINRIAGAGFAGGNSNGGYWPLTPVRRSAMSSFLARVLDRLVEDGDASPPGSD